MEMSFRWYGPEDKVKLKHIRQIPQMKGVVSAIYDIPAGEVWDYERIINLKNSISEHGLRLNVIESVPVHEDIKLGRDTRDDYIENYKQTLQNLSQTGIKTVCYNFMPVFDWTRTNLKDCLPDGSNSLSYHEREGKQIDPLDGKLTLPGWYLSFQTGELKSIMEAYKSVSGDELMENLIYFLERVIPVAEDEGIKLAIHPDDPPWNIFGLPRVVTSKENIEYILEKVNSPSNGLTFCSGSLGSNPKNDLLEIIEATKGRIHFVHARNVRWSGERSFQETSHSIHDGSLPMVAILNKLYEVGFNGPIRPDHGRMIWDEQGRPGYGLYDRALGATYLNGIIDAIKQVKDGDPNEFTFSNRFS